MNQRRRNNIDIKVIPHNKQRYDTLGDYYFTKKGKLKVRVSDCNNQWYERMIIIHELIEETLTRYKGITEEEIMKFDLEHIDNEDPGSLNESPYHDEHMIALGIEQTLCLYMGIDWNIYDKRITKNNL